MHYKALNLIMKPWCNEVLKKSENTNAFSSNLEGRCKALQAVCQSQPAIWFKCSYGHSRRHFGHKSHVSKLCRPIHISPYLSTFEESKLFQWMHGFLRDLSTGVFFCACAWMSALHNNTENHFVVLWELSWLPGNKLARLSAAKTLELVPLNL